MSYEPQYDEYEGHLTWPITGRIRGADFEGGSTPDTMTISVEIGGYHEIAAWEVVVMTLADWNALMAKVVKP